MIKNIGFYNLHLSLEPNILYILHELRANKMHVFFRMKWHFEFICMFNTSLIDGLCCTNKHGHKQGNCFLLQKLTIV